MEHQLGSQNFQHCHELSIKENWQVSEGFDFQGGNFVTFTVACVFAGSLNTPKSKSDSTADLIVVTVDAKITMGEVRDAAK